MSGPAIGVMAKAPVPGLAKTRLAAAFGAKAAAQLAAAMLLDTATLVCRFGLPAYLIVTPAEHCAAVSSLVDLPGLPQGEGDLGQRMVVAFDALFALGHAPVVLIGTDTPHLPPGHLREILALSAAAPAAAVVGPAEDGGYWAIALARPAPDLFEGIPWSSAAVLEATRLAAARAGMALREGPICYDIDTSDDLARLCASEGARPDRAPRTRAAAAALIGGGGRARLVSENVRPREDTAS